MSKMLKYIAKYSIVIVFAILIIVMSTLIAIAVNSSKDGLFFIPDNLSEYCYDVQTVGDGNILDYKNVNKISEFTSQTPIREVDINYYAQDILHNRVTFIENGFDNKSFAISWSNSDDAYNAELYISINMDGESADSLCKDLFTVDYAIEGSTLTINIHSNEITLHTYDNIQLTKDTTAYDFNRKLRIQFYTKITN